MSSSQHTAYPCQGNEARVNVWKCSQLNFMRLYAHLKSLRQPLELRPTDRSNLQTHTHSYLITILRSV